jgi:radical SAM protein with 4Fe4S-binding SPASM domain
MSRRRVTEPDQAASCYFRSTTIAPDRKALVQITERCNLHCAHCFVSAGREGGDITREAMRELVFPQLRAARVARVTLTGGEPFAHAEVIGIVRDARRLGMKVTICTNATLIEPEQIEALQRLGSVSLNVSLDGFSAGSHGRFRGAPASFEVTKTAIRDLGAAGLLKGILVTPNMLAEPAEYAELCRFAVSCGAEYVLMNPLSPMGRGVRGTRRLAAPEPFMRSVSRAAEPFDEELDVVRIRFPNDDRPLSGCEAGTIIYVFANGDVTICPYLVFAARTPRAQHRAEEFIVGNVLRDPDIPRRLDAYVLHDRSLAAPDPVCGDCALSESCGRGCPAAVVAAGGRLGDRDRDQCPVPTPTEAEAVQ